MDRLDRQILQALQLEGRAPFSRLAAVLGVSEQTIARRYRRLHTQGVVRVLGLIDPARQNQARWFVRAQCRPDAAAHLAEVLAARDDVSWVSLTAGGSEVTCATHTRRPEQPEELLLKRLPRTSQILSFTAHLLLHRFAGDGPDWNAYGDALTTEQTHHLRTQAVPGSSGGMVAGTAAEFTTEDEPLLDALTRDGRASHRTLATVTGWPESRVARRIDQLHATGTLYTDVEIAYELFGFTTTAYLWLTIAPAHVAQVGTALAAHTETTFVAAITGSANLLVSVLCLDAEQLYTYVTTQIGAIDAVRQVEISPVLRRLKQAGTLMAGPRLQDPTAPTRQRHGQSR